MIWNRKPAKTSKAQKRILDLEAVVDAKDRQLAVLEAERDAMAGVIARDRQRVQAEGAGFARARAEHEGAADERTEQSIRR